MSTEMSTSSGRVMATKECKADEMDIAMRMVSFQPQLRSRSEESLDAKVSSYNTSSIARVILQSKTDQRTLFAMIFNKVLTTIVRDVPGATISERDC